MTVKIKVDVHVRSAAAFGVYRQAGADFDFGGYRVARGTDVLVFTSATHTDARCFADPHRFDVERFRAPRNEHRLKFAFAPYGGGPHVCLGAGMGEALLVLSTATLLRELCFEPVIPNRRYGPIYDPSLSLDDAFRLRWSPAPKGRGPSRA